MDVHQYTAQSRLWLSMGIGSFLIAISLIALFLLWRAWRNSAAEIRKRTQIAALCMNMADALNWAVQEINANSSLVVSPALMERLTVLHGKYERVMGHRKGSEDEIE